ncbi:hypothetical protein BGW42_000229 [Actinomortierella wolfii]|nr:hypothetical protein BGW42_000229 [Actinomortierella wolfii]
MYRQLTWAFVGHRLDEIEELEIEVEDQERYLNNAAKMTRLRKIWIYRDKGTSYKDMHDFAEAMIKAIQLHHEPGRLNECHMIPSPIEWSQYTYQNSPSSPEIDISISNAQRVLSLLPPPRHSLTLPRPDGSTVLLNNPFDPFVSTIEFMSTARYLSWEVLLKLYPGQSLGQILQRFRGMRTLEIDSMTANGDDENILAWAACEAENYHRPSIDHHLRSLWDVDVFINIGRHSATTIDRYLVPLPKAD